MIEKELKERISLEEQLKVGRGNVCLMQDLSSNSQYVFFDWTFDFSHWFILKRRMQCHLSTNFEDLCSVVVDAWSGATFQNSVVLPSNTIVFVWAKVLEEEKLSEQQSLDMEQL